MDLNPTTINGQPNVLFVGTPSLWTEHMARKYPGHVFHSLSDAIHGAPKGDGKETFGYLGTKIYLHSDTSVNRRIVIPKEMSGLILEGFPGASLGATEDLGIGEGLLVIEAHDVTIKNIRFWNTSEKQDGAAIVIGDIHGAGIHTILDGCRVMTEDPYKQFAKAVDLKNGLYSEAINCNFTLSKPKELDRDPKIMLVNH